MKDKPLFYFLDKDNNPIPTDDPVKALDGNRTMKQIILKDKNNTEVTVSTVFLGIDHKFGLYGKPVLWETMIFGGIHNDYQERYTSYDDAIEGHKKAIELVELH